MHDMHVVAQKTSCLYTTVLAISHCYTFDYKRKFKRNSTSITAVIVIGKINFHDMQMIMFSISVCSPSFLGSSCAHF